MTQREAAFLPESASAGPHLRLSTAKSAAAGQPPVDTGPCAVSDERTLSADSLAPGASWLDIWKGGSSSFIYPKRLLEAVLHFFKASGRREESSLAYSVHVTAACAGTCWGFRPVSNTRTDMNFHGGATEDCSGKQEKS